MVILHNSHTATFTVLDTKHISFKLCGRKHYWRIRKPISAMQSGLEFLNGLCNIPQSIYSPQKGVRKWKNGSLRSWKKWRKKE